MTVDRNTKAARGVAMAAPPETSCPSCGRRVDPLRAGHVAVLDGRFEYFCGLACKRDYLRDRGRGGQDDVPTAAPPEVAPNDDAPPPGRQMASALGPLAANDEPVIDAAAPSKTRRVDRPRARDRFSFVTDVLGVFLGALAPAITLLGHPGDGLRAPLAFGAWLMLVLRVARTQRSAADPHWLVTVAPAGGAVVAGCWSELVGDPHATGIIALSGVGVVVAIAIEGMTTRGRVRMELARRKIDDVLRVSVRAIHEGKTLELAADEIRAGEQIVVEAGEVVGVDGVVAAGEARVVPWLGATEESIRQEGDPIVAGARVCSNRLRVTTTWSGHDRAWLKLISTSATRIDVAAPTVRVVRQAIERGAPVVASIAGLAAFAGNAAPVEVLASISAAAMAVGGKAMGSFVALRYAQAHLETLLSGIAYKDARSFERAGAADIAVLNARGTVLLGEPEIVAIEAVGHPSARGEGAGDEVPGSDITRVLALAAGAEAGSVHPIGAAITRAARRRNVRAEPVRNATVHPGLGVTALASTGERLVVGGRAIMLEEKIGVAVADARISLFEAEGFSVLLVALSERIVGLIALQDGLRLGARAAVQRLLDAGIEPVLLSGEARETCETIGRALDIDHVRPEVLPGERGAEVRALAEGGGLVAVIGHPSTDDGSLGAADVAIALGAAGSVPGEWAVALASDDVRDAARALAIPRAIRSQTRKAIAIGAVPGIVALVAIGFGIAPLAVAPLAALLGAVALGLYARETGARQSLDF